MLLQGDDANLYLLLRWYFNGWPNTTGVQTTITYYQVLNKSSKKVLLHYINIYCIYSRNINDVRFIFSTISSTSKLVLKPHPQFSCSLNLHIHKSCFMPLSTSFMLFFLIMVMQIHLWMIKQNLVLGTTSTAGNGNQVWKRKKKRHEIFNLWKYTKIPCKKVHCGSLMNFQYNEAFHKDFLQS